MKTIDHLSFKLLIFSGHIASFKIGVLKVQDFGNFELLPMNVQKLHMFHNEYICSGSISLKVLKIIKIIQR